MASPWLSRRDFPERDTNQYRLRIDELVNEPRTGTRSSFTSSSVIQFIFRLVKTLETLNALLQQFAIAGAVAAGVCVYPKRAELRH